MRCSTFVYQFRGTLISAAILSLAAVGGAQMPPEARPTSSLTGEVTSDEGGPVRHDLQVELIGSQGQWPAQRVPVSLSGDFEIDDIAPGSYELRVIDDAQRVIQSQFIPIGSGGNRVIVHLPETKQERPVSGTVSVTQLHRKIPSKAMKEFKKAQDASEAGKAEESIEHLKKAIEIYPAYAEAYNNLGVRYLKLNQMELAAEQFQKAAELDNTMSPAYCNLSAALYSLKKLPEAEQAARTAVKLKDTNPRARMMLGLVLMAENKNPEEALENIRVAERQFPKMRLAAAEILARQGESRQAADELKRYLDSGKVDNRQEVETWIAKLEQSQR
jgi:tetratricopeptide (TPR) repeat protein